MYKILLSVIVGIFYNNVVLAQESFCGEYNPTFIKYILQKKPQIIGLINKEETRPTIIVLENVSPKELSSILNQTKTSYCFDPYNDAFEASNLRVFVNNQHAIKLSRGNIVFNQNKIFVNGKQIEKKSLPVIKKNGEIYNKTIMPH